MESEHFEKQALTACRVLIPPGSRVIAAFSGGADSMALLTVLFHLKDSLNIRLEAVHIDHGLRPESGQEAEFAERFCRERDIPCTVERLSSTEKPSEDWARRERYRIFEGFTQTGGLIATAHTASDQAETVLLRLARGTGLHGLGGIPARRDRIIRPLLWASRRDTEDYCRQNGIVWVTDGSNLSDDYARNRVRHHALPALQSVNPKAETAICRMAGQLGRLDGYFREKAERLLSQSEAPEGYSLEALRKADWPVRETALHLLISRYRDPEQELLLLAEELVEKGSGAVQLTAVHRLSAGNGTVRVEEKREPAPIPQPEEITLNPGTYTFGACSFNLSRQKYEAFVKDALLQKKDYIFLADCAKIPSVLVLRGRQAGDTFCHPVRGRTKTLKKWLNELAVPPSRRETLPLLTAGSRVQFLWGQGFCREVQPDKKTEWVWILTQEGDNNV